MKILVLGASGLLGANFSMVAINRGHTLVTTYLHHRIEFPDTPSIRIDLVDAKETQNLIERIGPDWIVNCAAETNVDYCEENPGEAFKKNVLIPRNIVRAITGTDTKIVHISTDSIFPGFTGNYSESSIAAPINEYARMKYMGEWEVRGSYNYLLIRTAFYGVNLRSDKLSLAEKLLENFEKRIEFTGFWDAVGSFIMAVDLSEVILELMSEGGLGIFHVGSHSPISKYEFGRKVAEVFHLDPTVMKLGRLQDASLKAPRPLDVSLNVCKAEKFLGRRLPTIVEGIERFRTLRDNGFLSEAKICQ